MDNRKVSFRPTSADLANLETIAARLRAETRKPFLTRTAVIRAAISEMAAKVAKP